MSLRTFRSSTPAAPFTTPSVVAVAKRHSLARNLSAMQARCRHGSRSRLDPEYELLDTGIFNGDRYFDVFVEYAKATPTDMLIEISICNRGPDEAVVHVLPTLWFRNIWAWWPDEPKPSLKNASAKNGAAAVAAADALLGDYFLHCEGNARLLFTENETNNERLFGSPNSTRYVKDGINNFAFAFAGYWMIELFSDNAFDRSLEQV